MSKHSKKYSRFRIKPFWYVLGLFAVAVTILYVYHLMTGQTPSRVAIHLNSFNFDIFWYGIFIVSGIAVGAWIVASLGAEWARNDFEEIVQDSLSKYSLPKLGLPKEITNQLAKRKIYKLDDLVYQWGLDPDRLGLKEDSQEIVGNRLRQIPEIQNSWLEDAPWRQWNPDYVWGGVAWVIVLGVIGARLYHILTPSPSMADQGINSALDYFRRPQELFNIRSGGLGIFGAIAGGLLGILIYTRRQRISALAWSDLAVVGMAAGQFIGRWGNFFNQELYGSPTNLPWAVTISSPLPGFEAFTRFHPTFLYESLWNLLTFLVLYILAHRQREKLQRGDLLALYLVFYSVGRIIMEFFRLDSRTVSFAGVETGIAVATLVSIIIALPMAGLLLYRHVFAKEKS